MHDLSRTTQVKPDRLLPLEWAALALVAAMTVLRVVVSAQAPLSADEAYYWQWTRPLQLSYFDHPVMVALWIWSGIHLLGESTLAVRAAAIASGALTTLVLWDATRIAFSSRAAGALAALWVNCILLFGAAGVIVTPDSPLLLFWSLALWAFIRLIATRQARYFYVAGMALGLGAISKYTIALILPGVLSTFLLFPDLRSWLKTRHVWLAGLLALACTTPLVLWNIENHGASFVKQLDHAFASGKVEPAKNLMTFLGGQVGLVTPLMFALCLWGMGWSLWAGWRYRRPQWFLLSATSLPVLAFFIQHTQGGVVQAHWSGPAYLGAAMAAAGGWLTVGQPRRWRWLVIAAPLLGLAMTLLVYGQAATALLPIPPRIDALKRLGGWDELAAAVEAERQAHPGAFLFSQKHEPTGPVSFHLPDHPPVFLQGPIRPSYYSAAEVEALKGKDGLFITRTRDDGAKDLAPYFAKVELLRQVTLHWGGHPADAYNLYLAEGYRGGLFVKGDGYNGALDGPASPLP